MMQGTPYVYEGEELGETNVHYQKLDQYEDIESINAYHQLVEKDQAVDGPTMLKYMENMSRDNARTPMQWDDSDNAGFTTGKPWFALNPNYNEINAKSQVDDPNSVFNYYRQLIDLRHNSDLITLGTYEEIDPDDNEVFAYRRHYQGQTLLVISNFTDQTVQRDYGQANAKRLIGNYEDSQNDTLRPYETNVYLLND
jgi:oligo-1,6-glucosidase